MVNDWQEKKQLAEEGQRCTTKEAKQAEPCSPRPLLNPRRGQVCTHITQTTAERTTARYRVDEVSRRFVLHLGEGFDLPQISCHVSDIEDIYRIIDGEECFPPCVLASLAPHERDTLYMM